MATRTSEANVRSTLGADHDGKTSLLPFIRAANILVNNLVNTLIPKYRPWITLDFSGVLNAIDKRQVASGFTGLGHPQWLEADETFADAAVPAVQESG